jgi:hypothetical protein
MGRALWGFVSDVGHERVNRGSTTLLIVKGAVKEKAQGSGYGRTKDKGRRTKPTLLPLDIH